MASLATQTDTGTAATIVQWLWGQDWQSRAEQCRAGTQLGHDAHSPCAMLRIVAALAALAAATASPMWEKVARAPKLETLDFTIATTMSNTEGLQA